MIPKIFLKDNINYNKITVLNESSSKNKKNKITLIHSFF
jgi:hypothetical protein